MLATWPLFKVSSNIIRRPFHRTFSFGGIYVCFMASKSRNVISTTSVKEVFRRHETHVHLVASVVTSIV